MPVSEDTLCRGPMLWTVQGATGCNIRLHRPAVQTPQPGVSSQAGPRQDAGHIHFPWPPPGPQCRCLINTGFRYSNSGDCRVFKLQICFMNKQSLGTEFLNGASQVAQW